MPDIRAVRREIVHLRSALVICAPAPL